MELKMIIIIIIIIIIVKKNPLDPHENGLDGRNGKWTMVYDL